jgi:hypothetical protein
MPLYQFQSVEIKYSVNIAEAQFLLKTFLKKSQV